jgi:hypothetical protein
METATPSLELAAAAQTQVIDRGHLAQVTFGDRQLEHEVLLLFDRQVVLLVARMRTSSPSVAAGLAHTLKGSASGIGAWGVVRAAEAVERAVTQGIAECDLAVRRLSLAVDEARTVIIDLLRDA